MDKETGLRQIAQNDQQQAVWRNVGLLYAAMYSALTGSGVPENAATQIVCSHKNKNKV